MVHAGIATDTVMSRNEPVLFRSPVRLGEVVLKNLKPLGPLSGECRFNTVYPDSMRCLPASLRCGPGGPRYLHRSVAGTENRNSVNEAVVI